MVDCWGVGGLRSVENEVAPMIDPVVTACEKDKKHKTEGVEQPKRVSKRGAKEGALVEKITGTDSRALKSLLDTGGIGGLRRPHIPDKSKWELYETNSNKTTILLPTRLEK